MTSTPACQPTELGTHNGSVLVVAALPDGRIVTGGSDRRVLLWDPGPPPSPPLR